MPLLGAALLAVAGCDCGGGGEVDAGGPIPDTFVPVDAFTPSPEITITPALQDFGDVVVGQTSTATSFTVENVGTGDTGRLSAVFGGADPGSFGFASNTCAGMSLAAGDTCTISVEFRPESEGSASATLTVSDGDIDAVATLEGNGSPDAGLAISPTPHNFGDVTIGTPSAPQTFTVTNTGDAVSGMIAITLSGLDATQFELGADSCTGMTVAARASCTVEVIYNPSSSGTHSGTLQATASPGSTATAALSGRAATAAGLRLLPISQDFGTVVTGSSSSTVDFTLTNTGGVATGTISHMFSGANAAEFSVTSSTCAGAPLAGGASCTITVRFNAASAGAKVANLDVTDGSLTATSSLSANGVDPGAIVIEPSTRDYGSSAIGSATGATTFTVRNTGGAATGVLTVAVAGTNPADFPIVAGGDGCSGATLAAMGTCTIAVQFNPTAAGARAATLRVQGTPGGTATSALTGNGDSPAILEVTPTAADFGSVATGSNSANVAFTVRNTGTAASGVPTVSLTGVQSTQWNIVSNGCTASLAGGASCTVTLRFSPTSTGMKTAVLNVSGTPGGSDTSDLSGIGITPAALTLTPTTASYGSVAETTTQFRTFTVTNTGMETVTALATSISAGGAEWSILGSSTCGATLAGMSSCTVDVQFAPTQGSTTTSGTLTVMGTPGGTLTAALSVTVIPDLLITPPATNNFTAANGGSGVIIGASVTNTYTITNQTGRALTALTIASPTGVMEFTRTGGTCGTTLTASGAGSSCTVIITFAPTGTAGARMVNLTATASGGATETFVINGTARGALRWTTWRTPVGGTINNFAIPPAAAAFGDRAIGAFYDMELALTNEHTAATALMTMAPSFTGDMNLQTDNCTGLTLAAGASCTARVRFYPRSTGAATGALVITQGGNTATANITANGIVGATVGVTGTTNFGTVIATRTATQVFTVANSGVVASGTLTYSIAGARYSIASTTCPASGTMPLAAMGSAGSSCTITVQFAPSQADATNVDLTGVLTVGAGGAPILTNLTGRASSQLTLTPATASFTTGVGTTSATTTFTVTNVGSADTGSIIVGLGSVPAEFPITNNTCSTLTAGATCTFDVAFAPTANVDRTNIELQVSNGGYVATSARAARALLSGDARSNASLSITPAVGTLRYGLFYGFVPRGTNSATYTYTVRNSGDLPTGSLTAAIQSAFVASPCISGTAGGTGPDYWDITANTCTGALAGGASCQVTIRTSPPAGTTTCDIDSNWTISDGTASATGRLSMSTIPPNTIFMTPAPQDFGSIVAGTTAGPRTFTVTNAASGPATITQAPSSIGSFTVTTGTCTLGAVLAAGDACTFTATYNPAVGGPFGLEQAYALVRTDIGFWAISGMTGISLRPAGLSVTPADASPDFATTVVGQSTTVTYTVANLGDVATSALPAVTLGGADPGHYAIPVASNTCTAALAPAGTGAASSCTFDVVFSPTSAGLKTATLSINAGGAATHSRTITGTGIGGALLGLSPSAPQTCPDRAAGTSNDDGQICTTYTVTNGGGSPTASGLNIAVTGDFRIDTTYSSCLADPTNTAPAFTAGTLFSTALPAGGTAATTVGVSSITGRVLRDAAAGVPACDRGAAFNGSTVACGTTCTVVVQHVPQSVGADSGTLTVGATGIASVTGTISANGISSFTHTNTTGPGATYTAGTVAFGTVAVGATGGGTRILTLTNYTSPATSVMTYTITGTNAADFDMLLDNCSGGTFARGGTCNQTVRFLPSATGARTATLTVTDGTPEHTSVITLNGTGS